MEHTFSQCYFDKGVFCEEPYCEGCKHNPPPEEKQNGKNAPVSLIWVQDYDGSTFPKCPSCGEMPYDLHTCFFCGQKFLGDETVDEWEKPPEVEAIQCPVCGAKDGLEGTRAKSNGHFHGVCKFCGTRIMD